MWLIAVAGCKECCYDCVLYNDTTSDHTSQYHHQSSLEPDRPKLNTLQRTWISNQQNQRLLWERKAGVDELLKFLVDAVARTHELPALLLRDAFQPTAPDRICYA
jgi:hypothetical protein